MLALPAAHFVVAALGPLLVRRWGRDAFLALALVPAGAVVWALVRAPGVIDGTAVRTRVPWAPEFHLTLAYRMDALGLVMTAIVAGVGVLVLVYCARYFSDTEPGLGRFAGVMPAFAGAMLGIVLVDDLIQLYIYWELTTIFSYLLIGHDTERQESRRAAMTSLTVTVLGGLTMLVGIVMIGQLSGTYLISELVADPPSGPAITVAVVLLLVGAFSKSALLPFSFWLPAAMQAPTPVSAYLHAAAMVKAGVYLVARLAPAFSDLTVWQAGTLAFGTVTMALAAWKALRQYDLKLLLAYGTVSQLGFLTAVLGRGTHDAALAGLAMLIAHTLFKAPLFLVAGIVDHETGTRDLRELSGVGRAMPVVFAIAAVAAASMIGLPPLAGFVGKEAVFDAFAHGTAVDTLVLAGFVLASALTAAYSLRFVWGAFATKEGVAPTPTHSAGALFAAPPAVLAALTVVVGPAASVLDPVVAGYAESLPLRAAEPAHLKLWHGFGLPLLLSTVAILGGAALFWIGGTVARLGHRTGWIDSNAAYREILAWLDSVAIQITGATQRGSLPIYLGTVLVTLLLVSGVSAVAGEVWTVAPAETRLWSSPFQLIPAVVTVIAALWALLVRRRLFAVVLVGVTGYGTAMLFAFQGAADPALTQVLVETISLVVFVLVLRRLPSRFSTPVLRTRRLGNLALGVATGSLAAAMSYFALAGRQRESIAQGFPAAAEEAGGDNIVNVILVDLRAWDTMGEIAVLVVAATGVASLLFLVRRAQSPGSTEPEATPMSVTAAGPPEPADEEERWRRLPLTTAPRQLRARTDLGLRAWLPGVQLVSEERRSVIFEVTARMIFHTIVLVSAYLLFTGHNEIGGGFAGGIVAGLALTVRYLAGGRYELYIAVRLQPGVLLGIGLALATGAGLLGAVFGGEVLSAAVIDTHVPLLGEVHTTTSLLFDIGVYLLVIGLVLDILRSLGARIDEQSEQAGEREEVAA